MKLKSILKRAHWWYQHSKIGMLKETSEIRGKGSTLYKYAASEVDTFNSVSSKLIIGDQALISSFAIVRIYRKTNKIGNSYFINSFSTIYGHRNLKIRSGCFIAPQATIIPANRSSC